MGIHLKHRFFIIVVLAFLCSSFIKGQDAADNNKTKKIDLKIKSNSRENNPERQDNLHQHIQRPEKQIHAQRSKIAKDNREIKPNRKAILKRKPASLRNRNAMRNRVNRK